MLANFIHLSLNQGINLLVALIITPYLFQTLGESQYGLVTLGLTVTLFFGILVNYGFNLNGPKELALIKQDRAAKQAYINEVVTTRLLLGLCLAGITLLLISLGAFQEYPTILALSTIVLINEAIYPMFILQGFDRLQWISKGNAVSKLIYLATIILVVKGVGDAKWVNFLFGGSSLLVNVVLLVFVYKVERIGFRISPIKRVFHRLVDNFQFLSSTFAAYILVNGGFMMLNSFVSSSEYGFYTLAHRISLLLRMIPVFLTQAMLQNATRMHKENSEQYESYLKKSYKNGILITFLLGLVIALGATWIVRFLAGDYNAYAANQMRLLCFLPFLGMLNLHNMVRILVEDRKYILSKAMWISTIVMLILALIGCYFYGGYGLAVALMFVEVFNFWVHHYLLSIDTRTSAT